MASAQSGGQRILLPLRNAGPMVSAVMSGGASADTIAAIATGVGEAGIAIVRVSGPGSLRIADVLFRGAGAPPSEWSGGTFRRGVVHRDGDVGGGVDEVVLLVYRAPHSYTREEVVEFQGHGGRLAARRILNAVLSAGARPAEPGEFTRRAFLNGRIDLLQAEAVADLIRARSDRAASAAVEQLEGRLSDVVNGIYADMLARAADLEARLDFGEDELPGAVVAGVREGLDALSGRLEEVLATWEEGHLLREGAKVVIAGRPNVGKSSLLNCLLGRDRAIVTDMPGTTRDTIEEAMVIDGVVLRLVDTAGLREADGAAEREGVARAQESIQGADLSIYVIDGSAPLGPADEDALRGMDSAKVVVVINKTDLGRRVAEESLVGYTAIPCSCLLDEGVDRLRSALADRFSFDSSAPPHAVISERHLQAVQYALNALNKAREILEKRREDEEVVAAAEMRAAIEALGTVTGRTYTEELLEAVFSRFCVGK